MLFQAVFRLTHIAVERAFLAVDCHHIMTAAAKYDGCPDDLPVTMVAGEVIRQVFVA